MSVLHIFIMFQYFILYMSFYFIVYDEIIYIYIKYKQTLTYTKYNRFT